MISHCSFNLSFNLVTNEIEQLCICCEVIFLKLNFKIIFYFNKRVGVHSIKRQIVLKGL